MKEGRIYVPGNSRLRNGELLARLSMTGSRQSEIEEITYNLGYRGLNWQVSWSHWRDRQFIEGDVEEEECHTIEQARAVAAHAAGMRLSALYETKEETDDRRAYVTPAEMNSMVDEMVRQTDDRKAVDSVVSIEAYRKKEGK